ncbi:hypothetical protein [Crateriforma conspicua]|uniref:Tetratricopeptide repeat protein n=1 Tax=Crateriforma conspicua TaxID=2527996 RepID=A0A5C5XZU8_9PLAN|nr:hypothetical protein [Crateriforma conspicua]TWT68976.1 hypothetical protein Pan14r_12600 [Crateriforma conspicua]
MMKSDRKPGASRRIGAIPFGARPRNSGHGDRPDFRSFGLCQKSSESFASQSSFAAATNACKTSGPITSSWVIRFLALAAVAVGLIGTPANASDALKKQSTWQTLSADQWATRLRSDLDSLGVSPDVIDQASDQFLDAVQTDDVDPLDAFVELAAGIDRSMADLVDLSRQDLTAAAGSIDPSGPNYAALNSLPESTRDAVRIWMGRELTQQRLYDEALPVIAEVDAISSVAPASLLFYRGVCYHALLMKTEALADLRRLMENPDDAPQRFVKTAQLMVADIRPMKPDSLDEISRMMTDVQRRLDLGRANEEVEQREQQIIDKLTKMIDKIEEQQQQQQQAASAGSSGSSGGKPGGGMADSMADGNPLGKGDVDRKDVDQGPAWGNLPPAERHEAIQQISRDLPTHYRDAIEAYFRKMATDQG